MRTGRSLFANPGTPSPNNRAAEVTRWVNQRTGGGEITADLAAEIVERLGRHIACSNNWQSQLVRELFVRMDSAARELIQETYPEVVNHDSSCGSADADPDRSHSNEPWDLPLDE